MPDDYLFQQPNGDPMVPCTFTYRFKMILRENGLPDDLNVHSLRHTNASMLIAQGVDVRTVAGLLGHAQPSTTLDIYSHAFDKTNASPGRSSARRWGCEGEEAYDDENSPSNAISVRVRWGHKIRQKLRCTVNSMWAHSEQKLIDHRFS